MTKTEVTSAIISKVGGSSFRSWCIGLTNDPKERQFYWENTEKQNVGNWSAWQVDSLADGQEIESHFVEDKGMEGGRDGDPAPHKPVFIYVF